MGVPTNYEGLCAWLQYFFWNLHKIASFAKKRACFLREMAGELYQADGPTGAENTFKMVIITTRSFGFLPVGSENEARTIIPSQDSGHLTKFPDGILSATVSRCDAAKDITGS
jgi:hypothetical protein